MCSVVTFLWGIPELLELRKLTDHSNEKNHVIVRDFSISSPAQGNIHFLQISQDVFQSSAVYIDNWILLWVKKHCKSIKTDFELNLTYVAAVQC